MAHRCCSPILPRAPSSSAKRTRTTISLLALSCPSDAVPSALSAPSCDQTSTDFSSAAAMGDRKHNGGPAPSANGPSANGEQARHHVSADASSVLAPVYVSASAVSVHQAAWQQQRVDAQLSLSLQDLAPQTPAGTAPGSMSTPPRAVAPLSAMDTFRTPSPCRRCDARAAYSSSTLWVEGCARCASRGPLTPLHHAVQNFGVEYTPEAETCPGPLTSEQRS